MLCFLFSSRWGVLAPISFLLADADEDVLSSKTTQSEESWNGMGHPSRGPLLRRGLLLGRRIGLTDNATRAANLLRETCLVPRGVVRTRQLKFQNRAYSVVAT